MPTMKHVAISFLIATLGVSAFCPVAAQESETNALGITYVIPIKGVIERGLLYLVRRGVAQAEEAGAGAVVFVMDTPGGALDSTREIVDLLRNIDVDTYTFVEREAISAGAIISLATDAIYMSPGSTIGDAMPIMVSPTGGAQPMPDDLKEKMISYVAGMVRSIAQDKGHDDQLAESMVRPEMEYKIGEEMICPEGQLLTLTAAEAVRTVGEGDEARNLLSSGTVDSLEEMLEVIGRGGTEVVTLEVTWSEKTARWIETLRALFLIGGLLGIYIEFKTPGLGLPGLLGVLLLAVFFWGHNVAGLAGVPEMLLLVVGIVLLVLEIFVIPGFGLAGISGILLIFISLALAMVEHYPGTPGIPVPPMPQVDGMMMTLGWSVLLTFVFAIALAKLLPHTSVFDRLAVAATVEGKVELRSADAGELGIGRRGVAITDLRPAGKAEFGEKRLDVVTEGDFVAEGQPVLISKVHGNRIVVDPA